MRVGLLTGGGDCPGLNAAIRALTKRLLLQGDAEVFGFEDGFRGMIEGDVRPVTYRDASGILTEGGTVLGSSNTADPFGYRSGEDVSDRALDCCEELGLDAVVAIGGDGTMAIAHRFQERGLPMIGVPKTIDNDLAETERTFGFDTAVSIATEALDRIHTTAQSHHRVMIVETMGRYAGWIALHAGAASGSDVILIPEIDYDPEAVAAVCRARDEDGQQFTIIAIAEGATPKGGDRIVQDTVEGSPDPVRLGGISGVLKEQLEPHVESEIRTTVLGHMQRGGTPTAFDRNLATAFGARAARLARAGRGGRMVALQGGAFTDVPLEAVAGKTRTVPPDDALVEAAQAVGTSFGTAETAPTRASSSS
ncbi:MAG: 6-phosphofructokinase [Bacteroidetes bacterium QS_7_67_15]|nr:MAG: 6-phosphofructokinase [Bacteroidetes bacterium QS_7_67_15]